MDIGYCKVERLKYDCCVLVGISKYFIIYKNGMQKTKREKIAIFSKLKTSTRCCNKAMKAAKIQVNSLKQMR
ncbi:hypothetical protein QQG55_5080 [Brugia pahangi]